MIVDDIGAEKGIKSSEVSVFSIGKFEVLVAVLYKGSPFNNRISKGFMCSGIFSTTSPK